MTLKLTNIHFVLLAAGKSTRFKSKNNKLLSKLEDKTILEHNIELIEKIGFKKITLVFNDKKIIKNSISSKVEFIKGGKTRASSVKNALIKSKIKLTSKEINSKEAEKIISEFNKPDVKDIAGNKSKSSSKDKLKSKKISKK